MMSGYTKGPWVVNEDGFRVESENEHGWVNDGWIICKPDGSDNEANARLIAAAPELLEALDNVVKACFHYTGEDQEDYVQHSYDAAIAAIKKAKGE